MTSLRPIPRAVRFDLFTHRARPTTTSLSQGLLDRPPHHHHHHHHHHPPCLEFRRQQPRQHLTTLPRARETVTSVVPGLSSGHTRIKTSGRGWRQQRQRQQQQEQRCSASSSPSSSTSTTPAVEATGSDAAAATPPPPPSSASPSTAGGGPRQDHHPDPAAAEREDVEEVDVEEEEEEEAEDLSHLDPRTRAVHLLLKDRLAPTTALAVRDVSGGCGSMYAIDVASERFRGLGVVAQHRMVNEALKGVGEGWHGWQVRTRVP